MSTSVDPSLDWSWDTQLVKDIPVGSSAGAPINTFSVNGKEKELLMAAGVTLTVTDVKSEQGRRLVYCTVVGEGDSEGVKR